MPVIVDDVIKACKAMSIYDEIEAALAYGNAALFSVPSSVQAIWLTALQKRNEAKPALVIAPDVKSASELYRNLCALHRGRQIELFLPHESVALELTDSDPALTNSCIRILSQLCRGDELTVVTTASALRRKWASRKTFLESHIYLQCGMHTDMRMLRRKLTACGYSQTSSVSAEGEFCVRGSIIDIFPPNHAEPLRIDFFDDEIESIRHFNKATQRSHEELEDALLAPAALLPMSAGTAESAAKKIRQELAAVTAKLSPEPARTLQKEYVSIIERLEQGIVDFNAERFTAYLYDKPVSICDYFASDELYICEPDAVKKEFMAVLKAAESRYHEMIEAGRLLPSVWNNYFSLEELQENLQEKNIFLCGQFPHNFGLPLKASVTLATRSLPVYYNNPQLLQEDIAFFAGKGRRIIFAASSELRIKRLKELISEFNLGGIELLQSGFAGGFDCEQMQLAVITEKELLGTEARKSVKRRRSEGEKISSFNELEIGDYVVHITHGIGRYMGVQHLTLDNAARDYILIEYAGTDRLFLPIDQLDSIHKYIGNEGNAPKVNKLSGNEWERAKAKVRKAAADIADALLTLYAQREQAKGFAFSSDTPWQKEFEDAFEYEETPDQVRSWQEICADMERPIPMDRLLCGDVGYGKTEIAMRAAFKAAADSKQVAVLVPTTVLAQQHYETFCERFRGFPVNIAVLSRFTPPKQLKEIKQKLLNGSIDILIGTHKILGKDIVFRDLGLLIVDEEQRFGVTHKEKIKTLKHNIDVLTLSATPIPRTLHMSMVGMRDMSAITTPPEDRLPVQTYVLEYNDRVIKDAIERELSRGGQVFFLHNRVMDIRLMAEKLQMLIPEALISIAHGQMKEQELEQVMMDFVENRSNILLCTTIIESGIDMPNVNTLIVDNADKLGLAQLYQIRGRVGRSNRQAFAYFAYAPGSVINETARKRLISIRDFTQLGSGFRIAMRDMEIRGAGNILGSEQHGHIAAVGFDLYCKLVAQEVERQKSGGITLQEERNAPLLELQLKTFIPDDYIPEELLKLEVYRRIASVASENDMEQLREELLDRFGELPSPVINLLALGKIKYLAQKLCIASVIQSKNYMNSVAEINFAPYHSITGEKLANLAKLYPKDLHIRTNAGLQLKYKLPSQEPAKLTAALLRFLSDLDEA
ncbi:MAG: transcription-repair coupling factor [Firmicutes bacterium]|nr:transcription-repair coupling factor [Bacillota bacterium]